jgi:Rrf2 family protein
MKLTRASTYALHALGFMAEQADNRTVASHDIARARGMPERFLLKVLKPLAARGVLLSIRGPRGGYRLGRPAAKISVLEIVEVVDGPIHGVVPLLERASNELLDEKLQAIADRATAGTRRQLQAVSIATLIGTKAKQK